MNLYLPTTRTKIGVGVAFFFLLFYNISISYAKDYQHLNVAITLEPPTLNPSTNAAASVQKITYQNIFEGLTKINSFNEVRPSLASDWKISEDGLTYTFTLRRDVFFHDRSQLTATIVKSSLEQIISPNSINPIKNKFINIEDISVISKHIIRIKLGWSDGNFLYNLGLGNAVIQHPKSWTTNHVKPIGTGPYRFVDWQKGKYITLVANHHYWGALARIENINIALGQTRPELVNALMSGKLDGYSSMTNIDFLESLLAVRHDYSIKQGNTSGEIILAMNHANEMLASLDIRKAITLAIDKKKIADTPNFITGEEIGSHYSPNDAAYLDLTNAYSINQFDAKNLILKSGINIKPLRLIVPPTSYANYISVHVQKMLQEIGLSVRVQEVTWQQWLTRVYKNKDYDLTVIAHTEPNDLDIYARDDYYFNYKNSEYKQIIGQLSYINDKAKRHELLQKAQQKLSDDAVNVFLFMLPKVGVWHKDLRGYWLNEPVPAMIFSKMYWLK
jgi:peptide/nickel transport system substrate-binding protein